MVVYVCDCRKKKRFRLTYDGGSVGTYQLELCNKCHEERPIKFLISEKRMRKGSSYTI